MSTFLRLGFVLILIFCARGTLAQDTKKLLDHDVYDFWNRISQRAISSDGQWVFYEFGPDQGDATLRVHSLTTDAVYTFHRGESARFTRDASHMAFLIKPAEDSLKAARKAKRKDDEMPKDTLGVLNLSTGEVTRIADVQSFGIPAEAGGLLAYHLEFEHVEENTTAEGNEEPAKDEGTLVLHNLATGANLELPHTKDYAFSERGRYLAVATATPDTVSSGVLLVDTDAWSVDTLMTGKGNYRQLAFDEGETQFAFLSNRDDQNADEPASRIYHWQDGTLDTLVTMDTPGIPDGWWIGPDANLTFSKSGTRLFFGTQPRPEPEPDEEDEEEKVELDIWNWKDPLLQPMQLAQLRSEKNPTYEAVVHLNNGHVVQIAHEDMPYVNVGSDGDANMGLANSNYPYQQEISWDSPALR